MSRISLLSLASAVTLAVSAPAYSKTYYVDSLNGNDAWSGELSLPSGSNGPWRTFVNLAVAGRIAPGDSVLLRCGSKWAETLTLNSSGTTAAPIRVGSYPDACSDKPAIDGAKSVPSTAWTLDSGNVYKAKLQGNNLVINGELGSSYTGWRKWSQSNDASMAIASPCPDSTASCLAFTGGSSGASLLISSAFPLESSAPYRVSFLIKVPSGIRYGAYVRRTSAPWDTLGLSASNLIGNGSWQSISLPFTATKGVSGARLDIELVSPKTVMHVKNVVVSRDDAAPAALISVNENGIPQPPSHHPNRGHNSASPESPYFVTAGASSIITLADGQKGSDYLVTGSDLTLPSGASLQPGLRVVVRSEAWSVSEHTIKSISTNRIYLSSLTSYPLLQSGWGYYLSGARWMLDSPGEWHYDTASQTLYVSLPTGSVPGDRFSYSPLRVGIDINKKQNIVVENIAVRNVSDGFYVQRAQNIALRKVDISNTARYGIDGEGTVGLELADSRIAYTGSDAVHGPASTAASITNNDISYVGVRLDGSGKASNLPVPNFGALLAGPSARIYGNQVRNTAFIGISGGSGSDVSDNSVSGHCYLLNDCAGLYFGGVTTALVTGNLVSNGMGNLDGLPALYTTRLANGLYLDNGSANVTASDNTFANVDYGVHVHNGHGNRLERNLVYGGRRNLLWLQESANNLRASGNIYGNVVIDNAWFPTQKLAGVRHAALVEDADDFATYQGNVYSYLASTAYIVSETTSTGTRDYQLHEWQSATDSNGAPRNLDIGARIGAPLSGFASGLLGSTLVANGDLSSGLTGWTTYSPSSPVASISQDTCAPLASKCLRFTAGLKTLLSTPRFDVLQGKWYRVTFDAQTSANGQIFKVRAIQAGPTSYAGLMDTAYAISGSATLKRYSFVFQALATAQRSSTSNGARIDFTDVASGQILRLANLEVVPLTPTGSGVLHTLLSNHERSTYTAACPSEQSAPALCANYYLFPQGTKAVWPVTLPPLSAQVVFTQDATLPDSDRDGVADTQDLCPATPAGAVTNAKGCALGS